MSRLTWGAPTERFFETGVDRGVLYVGVADGVPWNGLVSVSESPTGGEAKPAYLDGVKFRNIASSEEFEATVEAFAAPKEFGPCDGSVSVQKGLFATQQPRRSFSMSYRTKVGNAVDGDVGYKIHLVYNALAAPAQRNNATLSGDQGINALSWSLTTLPPSLTGFKPTAHFIIDSLTTPRLLLEAVEDILYGTEANAPRMPLVSELVALFQSQGPQSRMNYVMTPSFRAVTGPVEVRRNICGNPFMLGLSVLTEIRRNYITDPNLVTASGWTGVGAGGVVSTGAVGAQVYSPNQAAIAGEGWTIGYEIVNGSAVTLTGSVGVGATTAGSFGSNARGSTAFSIPAGQTLRVDNSFTLLAGADGLRSLMTITNVGGAPAGIIVRKIMMEKTLTVLPPFNGGTAAALGLTYSWVGTANASASIASGYPALWATTQAGNLQYVSTIGGKNWVQTLTGAYLYAQATGVVGKFYAAKLRVAGPPGTIFVINSTDNTVGSWINSGGNITMPAEGEIDLSFASSTANAGAGVGSLMVGVSGSTAKLLRITDVLIEEVPATGLFIQTGPVFSGATPTSDGLVYSWSGSANNSQSIATGQSPIGAVRAGNTADVALWQGVDGADKTVHIIIKKAVVSQGMYLSPSYVHGLAAGLWLPGDVYTSSVWVKGTAGVQMYLESAVTGVGFNPKEVHTFSGDWERWSLAAAFPAGEATSGPYMLIRSVGASQFDLQIKQMQIEDGVDATDFFDGSTLDADAYYYSWLGVADLTASIINSWN